MNRRIYRFYEFMTECGGNWRNTIFISCPACGGYRVYFRSSGIAQNSASLPSILAQDQLLALKDLGEYHADTEDAPEKNSEACGN